MDEARFARYGPFRPVSLPGGGEGVHAVHVGSGVIALTLGPGRLAAEVEGHERLAGDPRVPAIVDRDERTLLLEAELAPTPRSAVGAALEGRRGEWRGTRRAHLAELTGLRPGRALRRVSARASRLDRWLDETVTLKVLRGPTVGPVAPAWWARAADRWVALRLNRARVDGWPALELAGLALPDDTAPVDTAPVDPVAHGLDAEALTLAIGAARMLEGSAALGAWLDAQLPGRDPERVRVTVEGPEWIDVDRWEAPGAEVSARRARWLLTHLDGLSVGGERLTVRTEPPIRAGRRSPVREPRAARRARLFSRWAEGVQLDEEGLYSVTPEALALEMARGARGVVLDATCGVGGLAIALARQPDVTRVVAADVRPERLRMAAHNARLYGVHDRIEWVATDAARLARERRGDLLVVDPPWGGPGYDRERVGLADLGMELAPVLDAFDGPVLLKLPRSFDVAELGPGWRVQAMVDRRGILKFLAARRP